MLGIPTSSCPCSCCPCSTSSPASLTLTLLSPSVCLPTAAPFLPPSAARLSLTLCLTLAAASSPPPCPATAPPWPPLYWPPLPRTCLPSTSASRPSISTRSTLQCGVEDIKACIKFVEEQTGTKWSWDAYFTAMKRFNQETAYELEKWDINKSQQTAAARPVLRAVPQVQLRDGRRS